MKELNRLLDSYQTAVNYYAMELSALFSPTDYIMLKRRNSVYIVSCRMEICREEFG